MGLSPGTRLGVYEVIASLGAGGMGQVYRARDTRLQRDVAIKLLTDATALDPDRLARFEREARVLASLNHPNVAVIHGIEEAPSTGSGQGVMRALVMELVDGPTLAKAIADARPAGLPVARALVIAKQIADAVDAAHQRGIVHRDLKPANVMLTAGGVAKVLDFGLAKTIDPGASGQDVTASVAIEATQAGIVLGTLAYMSPEQARGQEVDKRTDIWSFGAVLYEMLTGRPVFSGPTVSDVVARILEREPDYARLPAETPGSIRTLLRRCLERDRDRRLRDIGDASIELDDAIHGRGAGPAVASAGPKAPGALWWVGTAAAVVAAAIAAPFVRDALRQPPAAPRVVRLSIPLPPGHRVTSPVAFAPDGRTVAYTAADADGLTRLYLRAIDRFESIVVPGSELANNPLFSSDSAFVAFAGRAGIKRVDVKGGGMTDLSGIGLFNGGSWSDADTIVFGGFGGLRRVPASGGKPEVLTTNDDGAAGYAHTWPQFLPGSRRLLFSIWGAVEHSGTAVLSLETGKWQLVAPREYGGRFLPPDFLLLPDYQSGVRAARFNPDAPARTGAMTSVLDNLWFNAELGSPWFSTSLDGSIAYASGDYSKRWAFWVNDDGQAVSAGSVPGEYRHPSLSPDGTKVAFLQGRSLFIQDLVRGTRVRLTGRVGDPSSEGLNFRPIWSHDGQRVVFSSDFAGSWDIYSTSVNEPGAPQPVLQQPGSQQVTSMAPDGTIAFNERSDIWTLSPGGKPEPLVQTRFIEGHAKFSRDGRFVAYTSNESGSQQIYVQPFRRTGDRLAVTTTGGNEPNWSRDGHALYFRSGTRMMRVDINTTGPLTAGVPRAVYTSAFEPGTNFVSYDTAPDGRLFVVRSDEASLPREIRVILNWATELDRLLPVSKR